MSFQQGLSGLSAASKNLEVIGNNISNANTIGAKSSRAEFSDLYASAVGGGGSVGIGTRVAAITQDHTQGSITTTGNNLDLAINGSGYFQLADPNAEGASNALYSRNGQFKSDRSGNIINNEGLRLLGYRAEDGVIKVGGKPVPLTVPDPVLAPQASTRVNVQMNLDGGARVPEKQPFSPTDGLTYNYSSSTRVFDKAGRSVELEYYFLKGADPGQWEVRFTVTHPNYPEAGKQEVAGSAVLFNDGGEQVQPVSLGATLQFAADGSALVNATDKVNPPAFKLFGNAAADSSTGFLPIDTGVDTIASSLNEAMGLLAEKGLKIANGIELTDPLPAEIDDGLYYDFAALDLNFGPDEETGLNGSTQRQGEYAVTDLVDNGYGRGTLTGFSFDKEGILSAVYSNGQITQTAQVVLTSFRNPQGLVAVGGNVWSEGDDTGAKFEGVPGTGNLGEISAGALEESNVDLTAELVNLITAQRTYQANAQTIKTQDQVLQTFVNMR
jgi:flagellar hook protein FlgE